jgi:hypothetical protein
VGVGWGTQRREFVLVGDVGFLFPDIDSITIQNERLKKKRNDIQLHLFVQHLKINTTQQNTTQPMAPTLRNILSC